MYPYGAPHYNYRRQKEDRSRPAPLPKCAGSKVFPAAMSERKADRTRMGKKLCAKLIPVLGNVGMQCASLLFTLNVAHSCPET